jgi:hypothetical protein
MKLTSSSMKKKLNCRMMASYTLKMQRLNLKLLGSDKMNAEQIKKEIIHLKKEIPIKQEDINLFERIDLYGDIFASEEFQAYKKAMSEGREEDALNIYQKVPEARKELFLKLYDYEVNYFDKL